MSTAGRERDEARRAIALLAGDLGLHAGEVEPRGELVAKVRPTVLARLGAPPAGRLVLVTAMTPTPRGEGKTTVAIGLVDALRRLGVRALATLRQPSLGPLFGRKGGGTGGGLSRLVPRQAIELGLTGDAHAVQAAHNLAAAFLDNHLHHGNALAIDPSRPTLPRVLDVSDRALRQVEVGLGPGDGPRRRTRFEITPASEVMAVLALASDAGDLRRRLGRIVAAERADGSPVSCEDLQVAGAMAALLREALWPNLVQTREGTPVLVHTGAFANLAHGCSSVLADRIGLGLSEVVVTEAGFGAELGAVKFVDLKCRQGGLRPAGAVLLATLGALASHGVENLAAHLALLGELGLPVVVGLNAAPDDPPQELTRALEAIRALGVPSEACRPFDQGGAGCEALARAALAVCTAPRALPPLYPDELSLVGKLRRLARLLGADDVELTAAAADQAAQLEARGQGRLPVCLAKTHLSLSDQPGLRGRPRGWRLAVEELRLQAGAGWVTAVCGPLSLMPGLPAAPAGAEIDVDAEGEVTGLR